MTSANGLSEAANTPTASGPRDPLEFAQTLVGQFSALSPAFESGVRDRPLYAFLQGNVLLGAFYKERPEEYRQFANLPYWRCVRQKPRTDNVMRSLLAFTMRTKERRREALQNCVYKYARVLEYFYRHEVISDNIPRRLKDGGGIDAIYAAICRDAGSPEGRGAGLREPLAELPLGRAGEGTTDTPALAAEGPLADGEIHGDGCLSSDDGRRQPDEGRRRSVLLTTAASDATDMLSDEVQPAGGSKRGSLNRIDLKTVLAVEMFGVQLEEILRAKRATIRVIIEPRDDRGWVPVRAASVLTSNSAEGPWPGQSTIRRDDDAQR